jgi:hypothetical protein
MSDQDTMRIVADVVDKFSGPLKEMQKTVRELSKEPMRRRWEGDRTPPVHMIKLNQEREITPYVWVHPGEDR